MGCWEGTDMITGMSISSGTRIGLIILVGPGEDTGMTTYASDHWSPLYPIIWGKYDDYGGIEEIEDTYWARELARTLKIPAGKNWPEKLHDFFRGIERYNTYGDPRDEESKKWNVENLSYCFILPESLDILMKMPAEGYVEVNGKYKTIYNPLGDIVHKGLNKAKNKILENRAKYAKFGKAGEDMANIMTGGSEVTGHLTSFLVGRLTPKKFVRDITNPDIYEAHHQIRVLDAGLERLRRVWQPNTACGSQHQNHLEIIHMAKSVIKLAKKTHDDLQEKWYEKLSFWFRWRIADPVKKLFKRKKKEKKSANT